MTKLKDASMHTGEHIVVKRFCFRCRGRSCVFRVLLNIDASWGNSHILLATMCMHVQPSLKHSKAESYILVNLPIPDPSHRTLQPSQR